MTQARPSDVQLAPAPWTLSGRAYIIAVRLPREVLEQNSFLPAGCPRLGRNRLAYAMFVDYGSSDVGPYHELLYIPGRLGIGPRRDWSISRIFVSTWASVINGERNWGIPKDRADFQVRYGEDGIDRVMVQTPGGPDSVFAELELEAHGPRLPAPGRWAPRSWRTLSQLRDGKIYTYTPSASGHFRFARVRNWRFDPARFPDLARGEVVAAVKLTDFRMVFPLSEIRPQA